MSIAQRGGGLSRLNLLGGILIGLALVAVVVAYPPPVTGLDPLLGVGGLVLPLIASVAALLIAIVGGAFLARGFTQRQLGRIHRLLVRVVVPVGAVAVISAYLVIVAGFWILSSFIIGAVILAIVVGVADEFIG